MSHPLPSDYLMPKHTETIGVLVRCGCRPEARPIPLHITAEAVRVLCQVAMPGDLIVHSWRCRICKQTVRITARMLYLAA